MAVDRHDGFSAEGKRIRLRAVWLRQYECAELIGSFLEVEDVF